MKRGPYKVRPEPGSIAELIDVYRANSPKYKRFSPRTRYLTDRVLDSFKANNGRRPATELTLPLIERMRDSMSDTPAKANNWVQVIGQLLKYGKRTGFLDVNPLSDGLEKLPPKHPGGFRTWREDEIAAFKTHHPLRTTPRLVFTLVLCTGAAAVDLVQLGWHSLDGDRISYRRQKTERRKGAEETPVVSIPILDDLSEALDLLPKDALTFLQTVQGRTRSPGGLNHQFKEWVEEAGLGAPDKYGRGLTMHGLRKAVGRRLAERGASPHVIMSVLGHETIASAEVYTKVYDRERAADMGAELLAAVVTPTNVARLPKRKATKP